MWVRHAALRESVHARRRAKAERVATDSGRRSVAQRERMRLVAEAADDSTTAAARAPLDRFERVAVVLPRIPPPSGWTSSICG